MIQKWNFFRCRVCGWPARTPPPSLPPWRSVHWRSLVLRLIKVAFTWNGSTRDVSLTSLTLAESLDEDAVSLPVETKSKGVLPVAILLLYCLPIGMDVLRLNFEGEIIIDGWLRAGGDFLSGEMGDMLGTPVPDLFWEAMLRAPHGFTWLTWFTALADDWDTADDHEVAIGAEPCADCGVQLPPLE